MFQLGQEIAPTIDGPVLYADAGDAYASTADEVVRRILDHYNNADPCPNDPIAIVGYSRGGATAQQIAKELRYAAPGLRIALVAVIAMVPIFHSSSSGGSYHESLSVASSNVDRYLSFLSGQGMAAMGDESNLEVWPQSIPLVYEYSVAGASPAQVIEKTHHWGIQYKSMPIFKSEIKRVQTGKGEIEYIKHTFLGYEANPVWSIIKDAFKTLR